MTLSDKDRMKCISNTLRQSYYIGMTLVSHNIEKVIKTREGMVIYKGELVLKHIPTGNTIKLIIKSDSIDKRAPKDGRTYGYIDEVLIKEDNGEFIETSAYSVGLLIKRWS